MTAATTAAPTQETPVTVAGRVTLPRVIRSEWTKIRSLRSTWWTLAAAVVLLVGIGALVSATVDSAAGRGPVATSTVDVASLGLAGTMISVLALGVFGVLVISGEYGTGMIRSSMTVVPRRLPVLWGKLVAFVALVLPATVVASLVTFYLDQAIRSSRHLPTVALGDDGVSRVVFGAALYLTVAGIVAIALGVLLRHTAAGIAVFAGLFFVVPIVAQFLPQSIRGFVPYLPSNAGGAVWGSGGDNALSPWTGFGYFALYAVVLIAAGAWRLRRTDV